MAERVVVYSREGFPLEEVNAIISRQYQLERTHKAERAVMVVNADDYNDSVFQYMNLVVVFSSVVPTWVGFIVPPKRIEENTLSVNLYSAEYLLNYRRLPYSGQMTAPGTSVFSELIKLARRDGVPDIFTAARVEGGSFTEYTMEQQRQTIFDEINSLCDSSESYWWIEPRGLTGDMPGNFTRLQLSARYSRQRGAVYPYTISEGVNFADVEYSETSPLSFANRIYMQGYSDSNEEPIEIVVDNENSISRYGVLEDLINTNDSTDVVGLQRRGQQELNRRSVPRIQVQGNVTATPYPKIGDKCMFEVAARDFAPIELIIKNVAYSPEYELVNVIADNIFW